MTIELIAASAKSKMGTYGVAVVGHYATDLGRAEYELAQPVGNRDQDYANTMAVYLALHSIRPKFRASPVRLVVSEPPAFLHRDIPDDNAIKTKELISKFSDLVITEVNSDLRMGKVLALANKAANNIAVKGKIDEFSFVE